MTRSIISEGWDDYELIDSGGREKLERLGQYILRRPEPQALWDKSLDIHSWDAKADAIFYRHTKKGNLKSDISGTWKNLHAIPGEWPVAFPINGQKIRLIVQCTSSGHVGLFPEQADNWKFIAEKTSALAGKNTRPRILNLFAYTGAASLAALSAGAEVVHLDSVKQMINWTERNREESGLPKSLHLVLEDAMKFIKREIKRNRKYNGIIMDPPSYGRGPNGEKWILEEHIHELLSGASKLLNKEKGFIVLNWYSVGLSPFVMLNLVKEFFPESDPDFGEMILRSGTGNLLPLGTYLRFGN